MGCVARGRNAKPAILKDALVLRTVSGQQPAFQPRRGTSATRARCRREWRTERCITALGTCGWDGIWIV